VSGSARAAVIVLAGVALVGCATPLPRYPEMDPGAALEAIRARDGTVKTMSSTATVTMTDDRGSSVSFDAAIVAAWPDRLRLRAWKFGTAAFDLTLTPEGLWIYVPEEARQRAGDRTDFGVTADQFRRVWQLVGPEALQNATATVRSGAELLAVRPMESGGRVEFDIDRATLTVRACRFIDDSGAVRQTLVVEGYRVLEDQHAGAIVWPTRLSASGEQGKISIRLGVPEFNTEPQAEAFIPPRRATKQPGGPTDSSRAR
jgi:hypothetical protein